MSTYRFTQYLSMLFIIAWASLLAAPSGGPYGPVHKKYELPNVTGKVYYVAPDGEHRASGMKVANPTTIEKAFSKVKSGDAIVLRGGVYRTGDLFLNQKITMQPYEDEKPVLKGTLVAKEWKDLGNGLWVSKWERFFASKPQDWWRRHREGKKTPQHKFNDDMVFVDGKFLQSAGWEGEVNEGSYFINYETKEVFIGTDPTDRLVEITAFNVAIDRTIEKVHGKKSDGKGPIIRGITFTQYAYRAFEIRGHYPEGLSPECKHGKDVVGTTLEHCTISFCSRVAGYFYGDSLTIRHCKVTDTSTEGVYVVASSDVLLEKNIFTRNNIEGITGYFPAAVKIFNQSYRVTCNDNLIIDLPNSNGIWYDVGNVDGVFTNNWIQNVGCNKGKENLDRPWPSDNGFFFEISKGVTCAGNVFVNCDHGLWILNSSNAKIYNNTFYNSTACIARDGRSAQGDHFGWHPSTGPDVDERVGHVFVNNLMACDENYKRLLFYVWQPKSVCDRVTDSQLMELDYNVYVRESKSCEHSMILWSPVQNDECRLMFKSLSEFRKYQPEFSQNSRSFTHYTGPLFKSTILGNYEVLPCFPAADGGMEIPENVQKMIGGQKDTPFIGAYPSGD